MAEYLFPTNNDYDVTVDEYGNITEVNRNPRIEPISDLPAVPQVVEGFQTGLIFLEDGEALICVSVMFLMGEPVTLAMPVSAALHLANGILDVSEIALK